MKNTSYELRISYWSSDVFSSDLVAVILVLQHHIFESDAPGIVRTRISCTGRQQFLNAIFAVDRHDLVTDFLRDGMERNRQVDADLFARARHHRHNATG